MLEWALVSILTLALQPITAYAGGLVVFPASRSAPRVAALGSVALGLPTFRRCFAFCAFSFCVLFWIAFQNSPALWAMLVLTAFSAGTRPSRYPASALCIGRRRKARCVLPACSAEGSLLLLPVSLLPLPVYVISYGGA